MPTLPLPLVTFLAGVVLTSLAFLAALRIPSYYFVDAFYVGLVSVPLIGFGRVQARRYKVRKVKVKVFY